MDQAQPSLYKGQHEIKPATVSDRKSRLKRISNCWASVNSWPMLRNKKRVRGIGNLPSSLHLHFTLTRLLHHFHHFHRQANNAMIAPRVAVWIAALLVIHLNPTSSSSYHALASPLNSHDGVNSAAQGSGVPSANDLAGISTPRRQNIYSNCLEYKDAR